jgi:hypothetical protein
MLGSSGIPRPSATFSAGAPAGSSNVGATDTTTTTALVVLLGLYVVWAFVAAHERVRDQVQPRNIGINLWNLGVIALTVIVAINLAKVTLTKLAAWNVPGAQTLLTVVAST